MDPRTVEINNLRILNDYLNQTIETMVRAQRGGIGQFSANGLSHSPFGASQQFGTPFATNGFGVDPTHATFNPYVAQQFGGFGVNTALPLYASMIDPFLAQRALAHTQSAWPTNQSIGMLGNPWAAQQWSPVAELARQQELVRQQQQLQALAGYGSVTGGVRGAWGTPRCPSRGAGQDAFRADGPRACLDGGAGCGRPLH